MDRLASLARLSRSSFFSLPLARARRAPTLASPAGGFEYAHPGPRAYACPYLGPPAGGGAARFLSRCLTDFFRVYNADLRGARVKIADTRDAGGAAALCDSYALLSIRYKGFWTVGSGGKG